MNYINNVIPNSERIISVTLNSDLPMNIVGVYKFTTMTEMEEHSTSMERYKQHMTNAITWDRYIV